jgi:NAD(P)-dependent dehydrogenase (short-subunit alcohol dehydrogenase family)
MVEDDKKVGKSLQGRVALVTGGAKRLGRAVALRLAEEGADVAIHYRSSVTEAQSAVTEIEKSGRRGKAIAADLTSVVDIKRLFDEAAKQFGRLDILVNSAANFLPSSIVSTTEEIWDASLDSNLKAPFFCAQAAAPLLRRTRGTIINFADTGGLLGWPGYIAHSVSKAGVVMLTKVLAKALARSPCRAIRRNGRRSLSSSRRCSARASQTILPVRSCFSCNHNLLQGRC